MKQLVRNLWTRVRRRPWLATITGLIVMLCLGLGGLMLWTRHHVFAAEQALSRHDYSGAVEHLAPCLKIWSDDARLHFLAARAERCAKHYDMAEKHLRVCTRQQWPEDQITLERLLAQMQLGDSSGERYLWSRIEADDPDKSWILEVLIQEYVQTYRLLDALKALNLFLEDRPDDVQALLGRAFVFERLFYHADAVLDYRQALRLEPENETIRFRLAKELLVTGPIQEAAEHFEHLLHWQTGVQLHLARARRELNQLDEAKRLLTDLLARDPPWPGSLSERGKIALDEGKPAEAETWLRRAVAEAPHDRQAVYNLCQCLEMQRKHDEAREQRLRLKQLDADLKRLDTLMKELIWLPNHVEYRYEAGTIFLRNGEENEGVRNLELVLRMNPRHQGARAALAEYYEKRSAK